MDLQGESIVVVGNGLHLDIKESRMVIKLSLICLVVNPAARPIQQIKLMHYKPRIKHVRSRKPKIPNAQMTETWITDKYLILYCFTCVDLEMVKRGDSISPLYFLSVNNYCKEYQT